MTRSTVQEVEIPYLLSKLLDIEAGAPSLDEKLALAREIRNYSPEASAKLDRALLSRYDELRENVQQITETQEKIGETLDKLTSPPLHPAIFISPLPPIASMKHTCALVIYGSAQLVVSVASGIDPFAIEPGESVVLGSERNVIVARSPRDFHRGGETATFDRFESDGRIVLKWRDEEVIVDQSRALRCQTLKCGDQVRWDRAAMLGFEKIERAKDAGLFMSEIPAQTFAEIGGLDRQIETLKRSVRLHLNRSDIVRKYGLTRKGSVLLTGPPGNGKTMMARALANWIGSVSASGRARFMHIKPSALHSQWYSASERNYREAFRVAREAGQADPGIPVVMFFDEVDSIGISRGESVGHVNDRVLTAFMTELDGMEERGNVLVVAATNRPEALDSALLRPGRLGDCVIEVPRPNMAAARAILDRYLSPAYAYAPAPGVADARQALIGSAVSHIFAPNAETELATLKLRDGRTRVVRAADLISGASIKKIAAAACDAAAEREELSGSEGIRQDDIARAIADEFQAMTCGINRTNARSYIRDLPQDVDVVEVRPAERKVARRYTFLSAA